MNLNDLMAALLLCRVRDADADLAGVAEMALKFTRLSPLAEIPRPLGGTGLGLLTPGEFEEDDLGGPGVVYWKTGLAVEPPPGHYVEICPAGLHKVGWVMADSPIAIDPAFRGEMTVPLLPIALGVGIEVDSCEGWASGNIGREWPAGEGLEPSTLVARLAIRRPMLPTKPSLTKRSRKGANSRPGTCFFSIPTASPGPTMGYRPWTRTRTAGRSSSGTAKDGPSLEKRRPSG